MHTITKSTLLSLVTAFISPDKMSYLWDRKCKKISPNVDMDQSKNLQEI